MKRAIVFPCFFLIFIPLQVFATRWDQVKTPLMWTEPGITFILEDQLRVKEISWPRTLLEYAIDFSDSPVSEKSLSLITIPSNQAIPFQLNDIQKVNDKIIKATLSFFSDLPSGERKEFRLYRASSDFDIITEPSVKVLASDKNLILSNGNVRIEIPGPGIFKKIIPPLIRIGDNESWLGTSEIPSIKGFTKMETKEISIGNLFAEYLISYYFTQERELQIRIRMNAGEEFFVFEEEMKGFKESDSLVWFIRWNNFQPEYRYCNNRPEKPVDYSDPGYSQFPCYKTFLWEPVTGYPDDPAASYHPFFPHEQKNGPDGLLPFNITPYHNEGFWWRLHTAAFWDTKTEETVGLFIKDFGKWIDPAYPIYGNRINLSVSYYYLNKEFWWTLPLVTGKRSLALAVYPHQKDMDVVNKTNLPYLYVDDLRRWYGWISLNKVKNWILDYESCKPVAPDCFEPYAEHVGYTALHALLKDKIMRVCYKPERSRSGRFPVDVRNLYNDFVQEMAEAELSTEEYRQLRAMMLFMTYVYMDESLMPMKTMLAGHPDFFTDVKGASGLAAFLFPDHPDAMEFADNFEKAVALNLNYHVRPSVPLWDATGGRWTENLAHYVWASMRNVTRTSFLLHHYYDGRNRLLQPNISLFGNWLVNSLAAPLDLENGKRVIPPQGAHHGFDVPPSYFYLLGQELQYFDPLLAEHIFWSSSPDAEPFAWYDNKGLEKLTRSSLIENNGTNPNLKSEKFTGYGFIMRSNFAKPEEMYVFLQQIDEGLNARWGLAARGGNGVIYYYADGKRYSHNEGPEDVGDVAYGDVERITNFGVKKDENCYMCIGDYRSVGRNDLSNPLFDFGFAQFASINANKLASPEYISRSVLMSGNDYILIFDDVKDDAVEGRFSWFVGSRDSFPQIYQLLPGITPQNIGKTGRYYDGKGDFLTLVSHKNEVQVSYEDLICEVSRNYASDLVFRSDKEINYFESGYAFCGTAGIIRKDQNNKVQEAALFIGYKLGIPGMSIQWVKKPASGGFCLKNVPDGYQGIIQINEPARIQFTLESKPGKEFVFYLQGVPFPVNVNQYNSFFIDLVKGKYRWQWSSNGVVPEAPKIKNTSTGATWSELEWDPVPGTSFYHIQVSSDGGKNWSDFAQNLIENSYKLTGLTVGKKIHVRVIAEGTAGRSEPSNEYPIYPTNDLPHPPEGLWILMNGEKVNLSWGQILGANEYALYQRVKGTEKFDRVYSGCERTVNISVPDTQNIYEFCITATNGNGESKMSVISDNDPARIINWYPVPGEKYRRVTESYEQGYDIWNNLIEKYMPVLDYPVDKSNP